MKMELYIGIGSSELFELSSDEKLNLDGGNWVSDFGYWTGGVLKTALSAIGSLDWTGSAAWY